jgi:hypothetical protein
MAGKKFVTRLNFIDQFTWLSEPAYPPLVEYDPGQVDRVRPQSGYQY